MKRPAGRPRPDAETRDAFYRGRVAILQKRRGYRFAVDAPLLADFIRTRRSDEALEIGAGSGVISLLLSIKPFRHVTALEIQAGLAGLARRNVKANALEGRVEVVRGDLRRWRPGRRFDLIFSNPPYIRKATGFLSESGEKSIAKHEIKCDIETIMRRTAEWLEPGGRACFIYPERRREDFVKAAEAARLRLRAVREIRPRAGEPPNLFLAELVHSPKGRGVSARPATRKAPVSRARKPIVLQSLVLFKEKGVYTAEAEEIFSGRINSPVWAGTKKRRAFRLTSLLDKL
jgi:tRNA1Val (adenine37-N6)-methyltransferase